MENKHPLLLWIEARTTQAAFAERISCSTGHLSLILSGRRGASLSLAVAIERETGGEITDSHLRNYMREHAVPRQTAAVEALSE